MDALRNHFDAADETQLRGCTGKLGHLHFATYILAQLNASPESRILDVGCGDGAVLAAIKELRPDLDCVGVDFAAGQIAKARSELDLAGPEFEVSNVLEGPLNLGAFDRIYSFSVVQYFTPQEFKKVCSNLRPSLKANGILVHMSIPDLSKRLLLFHQSFLDQGTVSIWKNWSHLGKMLLVDMKRRFTRDRSYGSDSLFHDPEQLAEMCGPCFQSRIVRPSDSWYRFDIQLRLK